MGFSNLTGLVEFGCRTVGPGSATKFQFAEPWKKKEPLRRFSDLVHVSIAALKSGYGIIPNYHLRCCAIGNDLHITY